MHQRYGGQSSFIGDPRWIHDLKFLALHDIPGPARLSDVDQPPCIPADLQVVIGVVNPQTARAPDEGNTSFGRRRKTRVLLYDSDLPIHTGIHALHDPARPQDDQGVDARVGTQSELHLRRILGQPAIPSAHLPDLTQVAGVQLQPGTDPVPVAHNAHKLYDQPVVDVPRILV